MAFNPNASLQDTGNFDPYGKKMGGEAIQEKEDGTIDYDGDLSFEASDSFSKLEAVKSKNEEKLKSIEIAKKIFGQGSFISDAEIEKVLRSRVSSKNTSLKQKIVAGERIINRLKERLEALREGKNEYIEKVTNMERSYEQKISSSKKRAQYFDSLAKSRYENHGKSLGEEKAALERSNKEAIGGIEKERTIQDRLVREIIVLKEMIAYTDKQAADVIVTLTMQEEVRNNIEA